MDSIYDEWWTLARVFIFCSLVFLLAYNNLLTWETAIAIIAGIVFPTMKLLGTSRGNRLPS
jgi:hypothetical protein